MEYTDIPDRPLTDLRCPACGSRASGMRKQKEHRQWRCSTCYELWYIENVAVAAAVALADNEGKNNLPRKGKGKTSSAAIDRQEQTSTSQDNDNDGSEKVFQE